jgi:hypothetical protein
MVSVSLKLDERLVARLDAEAGHMGITRHALCKLKVSAPLPSNPVVVTRPGELPAIESDD